MSDSWSEAELRAAVEAYVDMHRKEVAGVAFVKKDYYRELAQAFDRTASSFEFRMQNISHVYATHGRSWVTGLKPAKNVGTNMLPIIERLIAEVEGQSAPQVAEFETQVVSLFNKGITEQPAGSKQPTKTNSTVTSYSRDAKVKAWVLNAANGHCECCGNKAPFTSTSGIPFLEVHHLRRLADGGSDTPQNAVALCPNCHRELHYGQRSKALIDGMYGRIERLERE